MHCTMCTCQESMNPSQHLLKAGTTMVSELPTMTHHSNFTQVFFLRLMNTDVPALDFMQAVDATHGVSEEGMPQESHDDSEVIVPETSFPINPEQREQLIAAINPMDPSTNYKKDIYERTIA